LAPIGEAKLKWTDAALDLERIIGKEGGFLYKKGRRGFRRGEGKKTVCTSGEKKEGSGRMKVSTCPRNAKKNCPGGIS